MYVKLNFTSFDLLVFLKTNNELLLGGVGTAILGYLFKQIFNSKKIQTQEKTQININIENSQVKDKSQNTSHLTSEVAGIVKRFNQILTLMNNKDGYDNFTIARFALILKLESVGELESIFQGNLEPSFNFISKFCNTFGIYENWLIEGKGTPFCNDCPLEHYPMGYLKEIDETKPDRIYFILCDSEIGEAFLLLKFSDWRYKVLRKTWHISSHVGAGGQSQIFGMYQLIKHFQENSRNYNCSGRILAKNDFIKLHSGKVFPSEIIKPYDYGNHWWDDFTDINHSYTTSKSNKDNYGEGFIYAQSVVQSYLRDTKA